MNIHAYSRPLVRQDVQALPFGDGIMPVSGVGPVQNQDDAASYMRVWFLASSRVEPQVRQQALLRASRKLRRPRNEWGLVSVVSGMDADNARRPQNGLVTRGMRVVATVAKDARMLLVAGATWSLLRISETTQ